VVFEILPSENFSPPPTTLNHHQVLPQLYDVSALALLSPKTSRFVCLTTYKYRVRFQRLVNYISVLSFFFNLNSFNYFTLSVPILDLYINFFSEVLCILYCGLLGNLRYSLLAYYLAILLLNII
jgi:hypothetical protein